MQRRETIFVLLGALFLLFSFSFAAVNVLKYSLGFSNLWDPFAPLSAETTPWLVRQVFDAFILGGPALALALFLLPRLHLRLDWSGDEVLTVVIRKGAPWSLVLMGLCLVVGGVFVLYFLAENWACLIGQQLAC
ncbi:MAG: hypothetical protein L0322_26660 [Chloroflexi bacterium]|nr:hypothetical protein [Chloroflexota bacterium]